MPQLGLYIYTMDFYERLNANSSCVPLSISPNVPFSYYPYTDPLKCIIWHLKIQLFYRITF